MILIIDYDNTKQDILLADRDSVRRFSSLPGQGFHGLDDVLVVMRESGHGRVEGVAVVLPRIGGKSGEVVPHRSRATWRVQRGSHSSPSATEGRGGDMSWSTVRSAVALANALAFAWGVPAVAVRAGEGVSPLSSSSARRRGKDGVGASASSPPAVASAKTGALSAPAKSSDDESLVSFAEKAISDAESDARVSAVYDGEPNITKPKRGK